MITITCETELPVSASLPNCKKYSQANPAYGMVILLIIIAGCTPFRQRKLQQGDPIRQTSWYYEGWACKPKSRSPSDLPSEIACGDGQKPEFLYMAFKTLESRGVGAPATVLSMKDKLEFCHKWSWRANSGDGMANTMIGYLRVKDADRFYKFYRHNERYMRERGILNCIATADSETDLHWVGCYCIAYVMFPGGEQALKRMYSSF